MNMKPLSLLASCLMLALPTLSGAAIVSTTTNISYGFNNSYSSADPASGSIFLDAPDIAGLSRFDPALGTLNAVSVAVFGDLDAYADIYDSGGNEMAEASGLSLVKYPSKSI